MAIKTVVTRERWRDFASADQGSDELDAENDELREGDAMREMKLGETVSFLPVIDEEKS